MNLKIKLLAFALLSGSMTFAQGSYISRLWNTKSYDKIIAYSPKGMSVSGMDNMTIGRAFMSTVPKQPQKAIEHYDLAITKRFQSEDVYYFRAEAHYEMKNLQAALNDINKCLELRINYQKYMLFKGAVQYEMGDRDGAYETYFAMSELYDKQTPFYMLATISIEKGNYKKAREWVNSNMMRFYRGKDFWRMTAEQQVDLEWHVFKEYGIALEAQNALLEFVPDRADYLINKLCLLRLEGKAVEGVKVENGLQKMYNENGLPNDYYKKGSIKIGEFERENGIIEDYLTFRPALYENTKYSRFYMSESGMFVGKHWAGLIVDDRDTTQRLWDLHRGESRHVYPATDTTYEGFNALFELPDSSLLSYQMYIDMQREEPAVDSTLIQQPEMLEEAPAEMEMVPHSIPIEEPMEAPASEQPQDSTAAIKED